MDINDFLQLLTPEQLEALAKLKRQDQSASTPKRKQNRNKTINQETTATQPKHSKTQKRRYGTTSALQLGKRPNLFEHSSDKNACKKDIAIDKKLFGGITPRSQSRTIEATCSRCNTTYDDVHMSECYKDESGYVFICNNCIDKGH